MPRFPGTMVTVLFLAANPQDTGALQLDKEIREIDAKVRASDGRDFLQVVSRWAVRPDDVLQHLNEYRPHIVHFSGHGTPAGELVLEDDDRRWVPVPPQTIRRLFATLTDNVRLVVLNSCFSAVQAKAITQVIDCTTGTPGEIADEAAITFAASLYRAIGFGRSIANAYEQGRLALELQHPDETVMPELFVRDGVDPAAIVLVDDRSRPRPFDLMRDSPAIRAYEEEP